MDTILSLITEDLELEEVRDNVDQKYSMWLKTDDDYVPSVNVTVKESLPPGVYSVNHCNNRGIYCRKEDVQLDKLYKFDDTIIDSLDKELRTFIEKKNKYKEEGCIHKRGILLEGYPGTGKTSIINMLSKQVVDNGGVIFKILSHDSLFITIDFINSTFRKIHPETNIVVVIEDVDKLDNSNFLLDFLDGSNSVDHCITIATTNNTTDMFDSFFRPSRFDVIVEVKVPTIAVIEEYFKKKGMSDVDAAEYSVLCEGFSFAEIKEIFTMTNLLDYNLDDAIEKIKTPRSKKNYNFKNAINSIGI